MEWDKMGAADRKINSFGSSCGAHGNGEKGRELFENCPDEFFPAKTEISTKSGFLKHFYPRIWLPQY